MDDLKSVFLGHEEELKHRASRNQQGLVNVVFRQHKFWIPVTPNSKVEDMAYILARQYLVRVKGFKPIFADMRLEDEDFKNRYRDYC